MKFSCIYYYGLMISNVIYTYWEARILSTWIFQPLNHVIFNKPLLNRTEHEQFAFEFRVIFKVSKQFNWILTLAFLGFWSTILPWCDSLFENSWYWWVLIILIRSVLLELLMSILWNETSSVYLFFHVGPPTNCCTSNILDWIASYHSALLCVAS